MSSFVIIIIVIISLQPTFVGISCIMIALTACPMQRKDPGLISWILDICSYFHPTLFCQDRRGLWPERAQEGMNRQDTYQEGQKADDQLAKFYFFIFLIQKRKRLKHQKHSDLLTTFLFLPPAFLLPVSLTKYKLFSHGKPFSVPSHRDRDTVHLQVPTLLECC
jgi:hypothetical protein